MIAKRRNPEATRQDLIEAAAHAFNSDGFWATDTNKIARAAGYAPQTFYRHFEDKTAIFIAVYDAWWLAESAALARLDAKRADRAALAARVAIKFHSEWRIFRRSLRHLSLEDPRVRARRAEARAAQIERAKAISRVKRSDGEWLALLLASERICDAVAEDEFADCDVSKRAAMAAVARAVGPLVGAD